MKKVLFVWEEMHYMEPTINALEYSKHTPFRVTKALNTHEAKEALEKQKFDWVVTGVKIAPNGGEELVDYILDKFPEQRVLVVSSWEGDRDHYLKKGVNFLKLIFRNKELIEILR